MADNIFQNKETESLEPLKNTSFDTLDFTKTKVGLKTLEDAILILGDLKKTDSRLADKQSVLTAIKNADYDTMRQISQFFYRTSGIYNRLCRYLAYMYRYDWLVTPYINEDEVKSNKVLTAYNRVLNFLDKFQIKKFLGETALKVIKNGCYYGYIIHRNDVATIQELPVKYCRSRFIADNGAPAVEFNMRFFDNAFKDTNQRMRMLNLFPEQFKRGYALYKQGKLPPDYAGDTSGWYLLDTNCAIKFNINGEDFPSLISVIPAIIDLDCAQELDKKKMQQKLLKIIIQKMPIDKNGDLVFDVQEAAELHSNAIRMLNKAIGVNVLTTFADVDVADIAKNSDDDTDDSMGRVKNAVYDQAGVSQMQFNTDGNIALQKSILNDEAALYNLIQQFEAFLNRLLDPFNTSPKKMYFRVQILGTTIYNYKELSKLYKQQTQLGYSKMLPQVALGHSQSSILATAYFENSILDLVNVFIPPMSSNTMSGKVGGSSSQSGTSNSGSEVGRPKKQNDQKSEKTIANQESAN